jgi:hypothetical protein
MEVGGGDLGGVESGGAAFLLMPPAVPATSNEGRVWSIDRKQDCLLRQKGSDTTTTTITWSGSNSRVASRQMAEEGALFGR